MRTILTSFFMVLILSNSLTPSGSEVRGQVWGHGIFSGDLGCTDTPILPDPHQPESCDLLKLMEIKGPAIIIAGSGMCTGGRIVDHLDQGLDNPKNDLLFVGY